MKVILILCSLLVYTAPLIAGLDSFGVNAAFGATLTNDHDRQLWKTVFDRINLKNRKMSFTGIASVLSKQGEFMTTARELYRIPIFKQIFDEASKTNSLIRMSVQYTKGENLNFSDLLDIFQGNAKRIFFSLHNALNTVFATYEGLSVRAKWEKAAGKQLLTTHTEMSNNKYMVTSNKAQLENNVKVAQMLYFVMGNGRTLLDLVGQLRKLDGDFSNEIVLYDFVKLNFDVINQEASLMKTYSSQDQGAAKQTISDLLSATHDNFSILPSLDYDDILLAAHAGTLEHMERFQKMATILLGFK